MNNANKKALVDAYSANVESAIAAYGWDTNEAKADAVRELAGEFSVSEEEVYSVLNAAGYG